MLVLAVLGAAAWIIYPTAYCFVSPYLALVYMEWGGVVLYCITAYTLFSFFAGSKRTAFMGVLCGIAVVELPRLTYLIFNMGVSCG
jgi:hypothetical protein